MFARAVLLLAVAFLPLVDLVFAVQPEPKPRKVAFLVGVGAFQFDPPDLNGSPQKDVTALADVLRAGGFEVVVLTDKEATKAGIEKRFKSLLGGDGDPAKAVGKKDLLLVAACTHGFTLPPAEGKSDAPFLAAHDSKLGKPGTMVSLNGLLDEAKSSGATALYLIDACREIPAEANRGQMRGVEGANVSLPPQTAILFSCRRGQVSHQNEKANGHGLFTWAVLGALRADGQPKDDVSWTELVAGVQKSFRSEAFRAMIPAGKPQVPVLAVGGEFDDAHLMTVKRAGSEREVAIAAGVTMRFCWIPATKEPARLGSPKAEQDYLTKAFFDGKRPDTLDDESESERTPFTTRGFWMGKYEVTQREWTAVTGLKNPSFFAATGSNEVHRNIVAGKDTSTFPVENVGWEDIQPFLKELNNRAAKAFGAAGRFALPHEDEWEYACRGGRGNKQAFFWGNELNGSQANCDKGQPYGTTTPGRHLGRPCAADGENLGYEVHPWGLMHMHGNVWEWCENTFKPSQPDRVLRGGSCYSSIRNCRAACRFKYSSGKAHDLGFRVVFRPD